jgi:hypothetical protein
MPPQNRGGSRHALLMIMIADILLKVRRRVKTFISKVTASGLYSENENGTLSTLQTEGTMIFLKKYDAPLRQPG